MDKKKRRLAWQTFKDVFSLSGKEIRQYSVMILSATVVYGSYLAGWKYLPLGLLIAVLIVAVARITGMIDEEPELPMM